MASVRSEIPYAALVLAVVLVGVAGYGGYLLYPRFDLPVVDAVGLAVLALAAGVAAFFSPCSFPLLAALLTRETVGRGDPSDRLGAPRRALAYATALSAGTTAFLALTGSVIAAGGRTFVESVTFTSPTGRLIRVLAGSLLILLGFAQLDVLRLPFWRVARLAQPLLWSQAGVRRRAPAVGFALFGFAYLIAGSG